jgi:hypothetical protein
MMYMEKNDLREMVCEIDERTIGIENRLKLASQMLGLAEKVRRAANTEDCIWTFGSADRQCPVDLFLMSRERSGLLPNEAARLCWGIKKIADQLYSDYTKQQQIEDQCYRKVLEKRLSSKVEKSRV